MNAGSHSFAAPPLAPTLAALGGDARHALDRLHGAGFRHVQLSASQPGMKPRELDRSARRDLLAALRRREIEPSGIDLWIPQEHFADVTRVDRAVSAALAAIEMAGDLGRVPLSMLLPPPVTNADDVDDQHCVSDEAVRSAINEADRRGVALADHSIFTGELPRPPGEFLGIGIDPVAWLAAGRDPAQIVTAHPRHIVAARISDLTAAGTRAPIGQPGGRLDVLAYKVALSTANYNRPVVLDARHWPSAWAGLNLSLQAWIR